MVVMTAVSLVEKKVVSLAGTLVVWRGEMLAYAQVENLVVQSVDL